MRANSSNMRIALIAPPFIAVPPKDYGGTELFVAQLAEGLKQNVAKLADYLNALSAKLDDATMARLNASVDVDKKTVEDVARTFLKEQGLV